MYKTTQCAITLVGLLMAPIVSASANSEDTTVSDSMTHGWVARGSIGRLWFTGLGDVLSNEAIETTTIRLEAGRKIKGFCVGLVGQISHVNGAYWEVQTGPKFTQGDSLMLQLGVSGRYEAMLGPVKGGLYADVTATRVPLLMDRAWYKEDVAEFLGDTIHEDKDQLIGHAGLGVGATLAVPIYQTGVSAEAQVGMQWITGVDVAVQTQFGLSAAF